MIYLYIKNNVIEKLIFTKYYKLILFFKNEENVTNNIKIFRFNIIIKERR
jgi:hypothetical protein